MGEYQERSNLQRERSNLQREWLYIKVNGLRDRDGTAGNIHISFAWNFRFFKRILVPLYKTDVRTRNDVREGEGKEGSEGSSKHFVENNKDFISTSCVLIDIFWL